MSVPAYPAYKDSGVEWLGEVPSHWEVNRLKRACVVFPSNVDKKSADGQKAVRLCNYTDVYYNDVIRADMPFMEATATDEQIERFTLRRGDTIFTKDSETADDIARSAYVPEDMPGVVCGYHLSIARPLGATVGAFIKRFLDSAPARAYFQVKANGLTRVGLGQYAVDNVPIALPPPAEQAAIAAFLDRETGKIDALVEEQRRLIALLKEKRQAVISHAVTKGLNPQAPLKPSGIDWLGEVPAHWQMRRFKHFLSERHLRSVEGSEELLSVSAYTGVRPRREGLEVDDHLSRAETLEGYKLCYSGDLVINIMLAWNRGLGVARHDGMVSPAYAVFHFHGAAHPSFWDYYLRSDGAIGHFERHSTGIIQSRLRMYPETFLALSCAVPTIEEQAAIAAFLDRETGKIDALVEEAERGITLLQERRAALISAAVTGKIDVRGLVATPGALEAA
jgi:type I restriction enzyme S subunit